MMKKTCFVLILLLLTQTVTALDLSEIHLGISYTNEITGLLGNWGHAQFILEKEENPSDSISKIVITNLMLNEANKILDYNPEISKNVKSEKKEQQDLMNKILSTQKKTFKLSRELLDEDALTYIQARKNAIKSKYEK